MAVSPQSAGSLGVPGFFEANAAPNASTTTFPQVVLDDPNSGSVVVHLGGHGTAPTAARNANSGTGSTFTVDANATDFAGQITIVTGSAAWASGTQGTVTFGTPFTTSAYVLLFPANAAASAQYGTLQPYATLTNLTAFNLAFGAADSAAHTMIFNYVVLGH